MALERTLSIIKPDAVAKGHVDEICKRLEDAGLSITEKKSIHLDYALAEAQTTYGKIGIKVWICKGEVYGKRDLSPNLGMTNKKSRNKK